MTCSLKTPLTFSIIEETSVFDEVKKLSNYEVSLITPANFSFYLNVNQFIDPETQEFTQKEPLLV